MMRKDKYLIYMLSFLGISYPLFEMHHILLSVFPIIVYFLDSWKFSTKVRTAVLFVSLISGVCFIRSFWTFSSVDCEKYCSVGVIHDVFENTYEAIQKMPNRDGYRVFYFTSSAYYFRLATHEDITKFDFIWNGNMGYHGAEEYIHEIEEYCSKHSCLFLVDKDKRLSQFNLEIPKYVEESYLKVDTIITSTNVFYVYMN